MELKDLFGLKGKNVVITGAASGMAKAAAELLIKLDAKVYALDLNEVTVPVEKSFKVNMGIKAEIDAVIDQLPNEIDAVFNCHGIAGWPGKGVEVMKVNFISQRYLAESLLPRITNDGSVTFISSDGGYGWQKDWEKISDFLATDTFEAATTWSEGNLEYLEQENSYVFSKRALVAYVKSKVWSPEYIDKRIRINCISPGNTETGLSDDFAKAAEEGAAMHGIEIDGEQIIKETYLSGCNCRSAVPDELDYPLVLLSSKLASYISGQDLNVSYGKDAYFDIQALNEDI